MQAAFITRPAKRNAPVDRALSQLKGFLSPIAAVIIDEEKTDSGDAVEHTRVAMRFVFVVDRLPAITDFTPLCSALDELEDRVNGRLECCGIGGRVHGRERVEAARRAKGKNTG